ncbi:MAG: recombinase family protein [Bryobacteraceae bacterium]
MPSIAKTRTVSRQTDESLFAGPLVAALKFTGCERIDNEKASGGGWDRPELHRPLDQLHKGDVLMVRKLDRLSRSLRDALTIIERLGEAEAGYGSLAWSAAIPIRES